MQCVNLKIFVMVLRLKDALNQKWLSSLNHETSFTRPLHNSNVKTKIFQSSSVYASLLKALTSKKGPWLPGKKKKNLYLVKLGFFASQAGGPVPWNKGTLSCRTM